jgi:hypothetical protein
MEAQDYSTLSLWDIVGGFEMKDNVFILYDETPDGMLGRSTPELWFTILYRSRLLTEVGWEEWWTHKSRSLYIAEWHGAMTRYYKMRELYPNEPKLQAANAVLVRDATKLCYMWSLRYDPAHLDHMHSVGRHLRYTCPALVSLVLSRYPLHRIRDLRKHAPARVIQRCWRRCREDPSYAVCRSIQMKLFREMA